MFIQVIQGRCADEAMMRRHMDRWTQDLSPGAQGWLGGTYGITDDGQFIAVVRFESREAAARNSLRPEQGAWWEEARACFTGDVTFHDCDDAIMMLDGGSDDAGFVQVIQGRLSDPGKFRDLVMQPMDMLHEMRPEIIGGTVAIDADGFFTQTIAFTTEAAAREGERMEPPAEGRRMMDEMNALTTDVSYHDLHHPWFATAHAR